MVNSSSQKTIDVREEFKGILLPLVSDLHRVAFELCRSGNEAEDLVAEMVVRACENYGTLHDKAKAKQWLLRILINTFLSSCRAKKVRQSIPYEDDNGPFSLFEELWQQSSQWGDPEREVINRFLSEDLTRALEALPEEFRVAVVLCDVEGYTYEEIAQTLEIPVGTVRSRLARGRGILQRHLFHHAVERGWVGPALFSKSRGKKHDRECECE